MTERPVALSILGWFLAALGVFLCGYHLGEVVSSHAIQGNDLWIPLSELLWTESGILLLRRVGWGRWFLLAWFSFHLPLVYPSLHGLVIHGLMLVLMAVLLFRADARAYFGATA